MSPTQLKEPASADTNTPINIEGIPFDEHLLISNEFTSVDTSEYDLHRLGYYWPALVAALMLVR